VSEEELASLVVISPSKNGQYSGSRVKALIQALEQLEKQDLIKEFMVSSCYLHQDKQLYLHRTKCR